MWRDAAGRVPAGWRVLWLVPMATYSLMVSNSGSRNDSGSLSVPCMSRWGWWRIRSTANSMALRRSRARLNLLRAVWLDNDSLSSLSNIINADIAPSTRRPYRSASMNDSFTPAPFSTRGPCFPSVIRRELRHVPNLRIWHIPSHGLETRVIGP